MCTIGRVYLCFIFHALKCALQVLTVTEVSRAGGTPPDILHSPFVTLFPED